MLSYHNHPGTIGSHIQAPLNIVLWKRRYIKCNTLLLLLLLLLLLPNTERMR